MNPRFRCLPLVLVLALAGLHLPPGVARTQGAPAPAAQKPAPEVQALINRGEQAMKGYRWQEALRVFGEAAARAHAIGDRVGEASALNESGFVCVSSGQPRKGLARGWWVLPGRCLQRAPPPRWPASGPCRTTARRN